MFKAFPAKRNTILNCHYFVHNEMVGFPKFGHNLEAHLFYAE